MNSLADRRSTQFQRLRNIKQLGTTSYVWPAATHTRFEHSLGEVSHKEQYIPYIQHYIQRRRIPRTKDGVAPTKYAKQAGHHRPRHSVCRNRGSLP